MSRSEPAAPGAGAGTSARTLTQTLRGRLPHLLWLVALVVAGLRINDALQHAVPLTQPWQQASGHLLDYRDVIVGPGRFLVEGGNPYDPATYLLSRPWAQEFDPYAPSWLLLAVPFASLPYPGSAAVFMALLVALAAVFCRTLARWALGASATWAAPLLLLWLNVWFPGRSTLETGSTFIVAVGVLLALRSLDVGAGLARSGALGVSLALVKPQFGLPLCLLLLAAGAWRTVLKGIGLAALMSIPGLIGCAVASGGPLGFARAIARDVAYASSPSAPTGLLSPLGLRVDGVGLAVRLGAPVPPPALEMLVGLTLVALAAVVVRRLPARLVPTVVVAAMLLVLVHLTYDYVLCVLPAMLNAGIAARRPHDRAALALALLSAVPVLNVQRVSVGVLGLSPLASELLNALALVAAVGLAVRIQGRWRPARRSTAAMA